MSVFRTKDSAVITLSDYTTKEEKYLIVRAYEGQQSGETVKVTLNHNVNKHITIKSLTDCVIESPHSFDLEFDEIVLNKFASIELKNVGDVWYILSSDGLKNS